MIYSKRLSHLKNLTDFSQDTTLLVSIYFLAGLYLYISVLRNFYYKIKKFEISHENLFLVCVIVPGYLVYEIILTKLPHYILPIYPALSILIAVFLNENSKNTQILLKPIYLPLFLVFLFNSFVAYICKNNFHFLIYTFSY